MNTGWPHDESPKPRIPMTVEWDGEWWRVDSVDVLGRWLLVHEEDDDECRIIMERYADPSEIYFSVTDGRPVQGCAYYGTFQRVLKEIYEPAILEAIKRDWKAVLFGTGNGEGPKGLRTLTTS